MTVKLAGGRTIVVDSKVALSGLLEAFETDDEHVREERLAAHARQFRKHVDDLASKKYWEQFESAPEFVVMFVPPRASTNRPSSRTTTCRSTPSPSAW